VHICETAVQTTDFFTLRADGAIGYAYDSATCPTLAPAEFRAMLAEAEELERG
jgi:hypothetical protein